MTDPVQNQIGNNTTASSPFVTPNDVVYFRGTDDKLWRVNSDGTDQSQVGSNTTWATPVVFDDPVTGEWVYFKGRGDKKLWKVRSDGSNLTQLGHFTTESAPFVTFDSATGDVWVYFQGTDSDAWGKLWKVRGDGAVWTQIGTNTTSSTPFVIFDGTDWWVFFQGKDGKLWRVRNDSAGSFLTQVGTNTTAASPFVIQDPTDGQLTVYFKGTDDPAWGKLWKVKADGSGLVNLGGNKTKSTPVVTPEGWVYFQGSDNKLWKIGTDGSNQSQLGHNTTDSVPAIGRVELGAAKVGQWVYFQGTDNKLWRYFDRLEPLATGTIRPKFYVLTLLYAPPGANDGKSTSLVDYSSGSTTGTKTSVETSFKAEVNVGLSLGPIGSAEFTWSETGTDGKTVEIKKNTTFDIKVAGPAKDGIDHDHDAFVVLLNPLLQVSVFPGNNVQVAMTADGPVMNIQYVYAGWLKNPASMAPGVKQQLDAAQLDASDYAQILSLNPFAGGSAVIDTDRYLLTPQTFAYEPPYSPTDTPWTETYVVDSTTSETSTHTVETKYTVSASPSIPVIGGYLKNKDTFEWTNKNTIEITQGTEDKATASVGGPSFGYGGPTDILVYWDTLFKSFMFAFPVEPVVGAARDLTSRPSIGG